MALSRRVPLLLAVGLLIPRAAEARQSGRLTVRAVSVQVDARVQPMHVLQRLSVAGHQGPLGLEALVFDEVTFDSVRIRVSGTRPRVFPVIRQGRRLSVQGPPLDADSAQIELSYRVPALLATGDRSHLVTPLLAVVGSGVGPATAEFFEAEVRLPPELDVREAFPSVFLTDGGGVYRAALSTQPALIRIRARPRTDHGVTGLGLYETAVVTLIGALSWLGWRHLQRNV